MVLRIFPPENPHWLARRSEEEITVLSFLWGYSREQSVATPVWYRPSTMTCFVFVTVGSLFCQPDFVFWHGETNSNCFHLISFNAVGYELKKSYVFLLFRGQVCWRGGPRHDTSSHRRSKCEGSAAGYRTSAVCCPGGGEHWAGPRRSDLTVRAHPIPSEILSDLTVRAYPIPSVILSDLTVRAHPIPAEILSDLTVRAHPIPAEILSDLTVRAHPIPAEILSDLTVRAHPIPSEILSDLTVRAHPIPSEILSDLTVRAHPIPSKILSDLTVRAHPIPSEILSDLTVRAHPIPSEILSDLTVRAHPIPSEILSDLTVRAHPIPKVEVSFRNLIRPHS